MGVGGVDKKVRVGMSVAVNHNECEKIDERRESESTRVVWKEDKVSRSSEEKKVGTSIVRNNK